MAFAASCGTSVRYCLWSATLQAMAPPADRSGLGPDKLQAQGGNPTEYRLVPARPIFVTALAIPMEDVEVARDENVLTEFFSDKCRQIGDQAMR